MPTKAELEAEITVLQNTIQKQSKALTELSQQECVRIHLPVWEHHALTGGAPNIKDDSGIDLWREQVMPAITKVIEELGVSTNTPGACASPTIRLHESSYREPKNFIVPRIVGEFICSFLNAAATFGKVCYARGVEQGTELLISLAQDKITLTDLEDSVKLENKIKTNSEGKFRIHDPQ